MSSSGGLRRGQGEPGQPPGAAQVDAFEDGGHLGGGDLDAAVLGLGKAERPLLQPLVPERQAVAVPVEDLDPVAPAVPEDEEVPRERVLGDPVADELAPGRRSPCACRRVRRRGRCGVSRRGSTWPALEHGDDPPQGLRVEPRLDHDPPARPDHDLDARAVRRLTPRDGLDDPDRQERGHRGGCGRLIDVPLGFAPGRLRRPV